MRGAGSVTAREAALRALARRDLSVHELERRLAERGFSEEERAETVEALVRTGLLDDARFAAARAQALAARGAGDALIRHDLAAAGVAPELVEEALAALEGEEERARALVARRGAGARAVRTLLAKGFAPEVAAAAGGEETSELA
ncbi:MAG TPA: RecX family transcriptional regulator [Gaiellaceae bacterium]|nr:RecX family transcriptional regulator [Gaiellaceae bacterium]